MGSLQDQLMKAGLATPEQLRRARGEQRQEQQRERGGQRDRRAGSRAPGQRPPATRRRGGPRPSSAPAAGDAEQRRDGGERANGRKARSRGSGERPSGAGRDRRHRRGAPDGAPGRSPEPGPGGARSPNLDPDPSVQSLNLRIRALLDTHALNDKAAESAFNFRRENVVRRVYATDEQHRGLASGELAIVGFRRRHHIVPAAVADEIRALRPIVFIHRTDPESAESGSEEAEADALYRDFPVPDDLYW